MTETVKFFARYEFSSVRRKYFPDGKAEWEKFIIFVWDNQLFRI